MTILVKIEEIIDDIEERYAEIDEKVEETLDKVYEKVPGKYFGLIGVTIYIFSTFIAFILYYSADPSYSIFTHWISHLGNGPNGSNLVFNIGWIISSFILFFFHVYEIRTFRIKGAKERYLDLMSLMALSFSVGLLFIGIFPLNLGVSHSVAAFFYFLGGFGFALLYGILNLLIPRIPKKYAIVAFTTATCYLLYFLSPSITPYASKIGITMTFLEWITLIAEFTMMVVVVESSFKNRNQQRIVIETQNLTKN